MKKAMRGFKMNSPLKQTKSEGETNPNKSKTGGEQSTIRTYPGIEGGYNVTVTERKVKRLHNVEMPKESTTQKRTTPGGHVKELLKGAKNLGPNYRPSEALRKKSNKALAEAKAKDAAESKLTPTETPSKGKSKTVEVEETELMTKPELTKAKEGTTNDVFTSEQKRKHIRTEKLSNRRERQEGRQELRSDIKAVRNTADWAKMSGKERQAAIYEIKHGQTSEEKASGKSALDRFGDIKSNAEISRAKKFGQGELNLKRVKQAKEKPGERTAAEAAQFLENKNAGVGYSGIGRISLETEYGKGNVKAEAGGEKVKATDETRPDVTGKTGKSITEKTTTRDEDSGNANMPNNYEKNPPYMSSLRQNQGPESSPTKMLKRGFTMKGFGSKIGFNFNNRKK